MEDTATMDRVVLERDWNNKRLEDPCWELFRSTHQLTLHDGCQLVHWELKRGRPVILSFYKLKTLRLDYHSGIVAELLSGSGSHRIVVNGRPTQSLPGVFFWTPAFAEVRYIPVNVENPSGNYRLSLQMCVKTASRYAQGRDGDVFFSSLKEFRKNWPGII